MKKSAFFMSVLTLGIAGLFIFQNCGGPSASTGQKASVNEAADTNNNGGGDVTPDIPDPDPQPVGGLALRDIMLDNPLLPGEQLNTGYSFAVGVDIAHYETAYRATTKTTYVKIQWDGSTYQFVVDGDNCSGQLPLTFEEITDANIGGYGYAFITNYFNERLASPTQMDCALPKATITTVPVAQKDVVIYVTKNVQCIPKGAHYLDPNNPQNSPTLIDDIQNFYHSRIDQVCGN